MRSFNQLPLKQKIFLPQILFISITLVFIGVWQYNLFLKNLKQQAFIRANDIAHSLGFTAQIVHQSYEFQRMVYALGSNLDIQGIILVADETKTILACNQRKFLGKPLESKEIPPVAKELHKILQEEEPQHFFFFNKNKNNSYTYFITLKLPPRTGFPSLNNHAYLGIQIDTSFIKSALIQQGIHATIILTILLCCFTFLAYYLMDKYILKPLGQIQKSANERKMGNPYAHIPITSPDEIGDLAFTLNTLIQAQEKSETLFKTLLELAPVLFWMSDKKHSFFYFSNKWLEFTGKPLTEEVQWGWSNNLPPEEKDSIIKSYKQFMAKKESFRFDHKLRHHGGNYRWMASQACPRFLPDGTFEGYIGCLIDINGHIESEQKLQQYTQALSIARDNALKAAKTKAEFLATMSHEIRTPMNAILGFGSLLKETPLTPDQIDFLDRIIRNTKLLLDLINQILDFSKLEAGKLALVQKHFSLRKSIQEVYDLFHPSVSQKKLSLLQEIDPNLPDHLIGDLGRIKQVLINLMSNAIKFTEKGSIKIVLEKEALGKTDPREASDENDSQQVRINFKVIDSGIGIGEENKKLIFEPFTQANQAVAYQFGGTGLGLSICNSLLSLMNSGLHCQSEVQKGSIFSFSLLLDVDTSESKSVPSLLQETTSSFENYLIAYADDNLENQRLVKAILGRQGYPLKITRNGQDLIQLLQQVQVKLILMDLRMPQIDGYKATQMIRAGKGGPLHIAIPIIALSAYNSKEEKEKCLAVGMNDFISKPFEPQQLLAKIQKWIPRPPSN